ncbi:transcriptional regulator [Streptomyces smyrnaeus]
MPDRRMPYECPRDGTPATGSAPGRAPSMLHRLAAERATGAFTRAAGTLFLVDGEVVHAESGAATGLELLLTRCCPLSQADWEAALSRAGREGGVAQHLVACGLVPAGVLDLCRRTALYDAAFFVLATGGGAGRFRRGVRDRLGVSRGLAPTAVERETARRLALLDRIWPDARVDVLPPVPTAPIPPTVPGRQLPILQLADGARTATDIARILGRPTFHLLVELRRLAAGGLVVPALPVGPEPHGRQPPPAPAHPPPQEASPAQTPQQETTAGGGPSAAVAPGHEFTDPDVALLRRLRDALEAW